MANRCWLRALGDRGMLAVLMLAGYGVAVCQPQPSPSPSPRRPIGSFSSEANQNDLRAARLLSMEMEIRTIPDPAMRCRLRLDILSFIYLKKIRSQYAAAEPMVSAFFDDVDQIIHMEGTPDHKTSMGHDLLGMIQKHAPETAKKFAQRYKLDAIGSEKDYEDLQAGADASQVGDRVAAEIRNGVIPAHLSDIFNRVLSKDSYAAQRLAGAMLASTDERSESSRIAILVDAIEKRPPDKRLPVSDDMRRNFYRLVIDLARKRIAATKPATSEYAVTYPLEVVLSGIKELDPALYTEARSVMEQGRKALTPQKLALAELSDRIMASDDPLAAAIEQAYTATDPKLRDAIWVLAASLACRGEQWKRAVDLIMNADPDLNDPKQRGGRDVLIDTMIARRAAEKKDYSAIEYAIGRIVDPVVKARSMFIVGSEISRWSYNRPEERERALAKITGAFRAVGKGAIRPDDICWANSGAKDLMRMKGVNQRDAWEIAMQVVEFANHAPVPDVATVTRSNVPKTYDTDAVMAGTLCIKDLFEKIAPPTAESSTNLAELLNMREWRLTALIQIETRRAYLQDRPTSVTK